MSAAPQLRGLLAGSTRKHLYGMIIFVTTTTVCFKTLIYDGRRRRYEEFYKHYDAEQEFQRMRKAGIFRSAPPE